VQKIDGLEKLGMLPGLARVLHLPATTYYSKARYCTLTKNFAGIIH
jgi:hypothetical protein